MLIVNADDFGVSPSASDPTILLYEQGALSSASAMVGMRDTARAASLARERGLPTGLHLNLTLPFAEPTVPAPAGERQRRLTEAFGRESWREGSGRNPDSRLIADAIADQLERFRAAFGEPTHLDGHHHIHVHPAVLEQLPPGLLIRPILSVPARAEAEPSARLHDLRQRAAGPDLCFALGHVHPALGGDGLQALELARERSLEIMAHPQQKRERLALESAQWHQALAALAVGSYADLARVIRSR
jgi:chitin disaccharide deacetylase